MLMFAPFTRTAVVISRSAYVTNYAATDKMLDAARPEVRVVLEGLGAVIRRGRSMPSKTTIKDETTIFRVSKTISKSGEVAGQVRSDVRISGGPSQSGSGIIVTVASGLAFRHAVSR